MTIPNMPAADTPVGSSDADNPVVRTWREPAKFAFEPQAHWDIGEKLNILDVERAGKVSGARFTFYRGLGSRLERSVINFFLDIHTGENGYTEFFPPFIVNKDSMQEQASFLNLLKICSNWRAGLLPDPYCRSSDHESAPRRNFKRRRSSAVLYCLQRLLPR
mgnify:FL=1